MNSQWELLRSALQNNYGFRELTLIQKSPLLIQTERGIKKIRIWENERLFSLHLEWRQKLIQNQFFLDRMYATVSGSRNIRFDRYLITCHDAPLEEAEVVGMEQIWAVMLSSLLQNSRGRIPVLRSSQLSAQAAFTYAQAERSRFSGKRLGTIAQSCYPSVLLRAQKADQLRNGHRSGRAAFLLPENYTFQSTRSLLGTLFLELGQNSPTGGYRALAQFLLHLILEKKNESLKKLLLLLHHQSSTQEEISDLLLAEWYDPQEWFGLFQLPESLNPEAEEQATLDYKKVWDAKTQIIRLFQSIFQPAASVAEGR